MMSSLKTESIGLQSKGTSSKIKSRAWILHREFFTTGGGIEENPIGGEMVGDVKKKTEATTRAQ